VSEQTPPAEAAADVEAPAAVSAEAHGATDAPGDRRARVMAVARGLLLTGVAVALLVVVLPRVSGTTWTAIGATLGRLGPGDLAVLAVLWVLGMYAQSFVFAAALPGLGNARAVLLNLSGSSVSNVLPLGGAAGVGVTYAIVRSWGFSRTSFALFAGITNIWDTSSKLVLPAVALLALVLSGEARDSTLLLAAGTAAAVLAFLVALVVAAVSSERVAVRAGGRVEHAANAVLRRVHSSRRVHHLAEWLREARRRSQHLLRKAWPQLTLGIIAYDVMLFVLLLVCLRMLGATAPAVAVFAAFALERLLTLAVVTPGGSGLAESGSAALLVALGVEPATAAAGVLLYRGFILGMEVPVGGVCLLVWLVRHRRRQRRAA
jgi:uncharacterized membrane protein YbhN (UPF0104 family)